MPDGQQNPVWTGIRYPGPPEHKIDAPRLITPLAIHAPATLDCDALVIGSGAGGGVVAGELSAAGFDVLVVEKGGYYAERDFHGQEMVSGDHLFEKHSLLTTADTAMTVLAGSTLGGGTTINWSTSFRTPGWVLEEWATTALLPRLPEYQQPGRGRAASQRQRRRASQSEQRRWNRAARPRLPQRRDRATSEAVRSAATAATAARSVRSRARSGTISRTPTSAARISLTPI
jgi:choline dehydrogenase-like flavoprotein